MVKEDLKIIRNLLRDLVIDLSEQRYGEIVKSGRSGILDEDIIKKLIHSYPGNITIPPHNAFDEIDFIEYDDNSGEGEVEFLLWYDNKKSDLTLTTEIFKDISGKVHIRIYDILVM